MKNILKTAPLFYLVIMLMLTLMMSSCTKKPPLYNDTTPADVTTTLSCSHNYTSTFVEPTAKEDGGTKHTCATCGDSYITDVITPIDFTITSENRTMVGYSEAGEENFVIPAVFEEDGVWYRVVGVGRAAFYKCNLSSIVISDSVTNIEKSAFFECHSLTSIVIPDSVTSIGEEAFYACTALTSINIPDSVTSIGYAAFSLCTSLLSITIPSNVTYIGNEAFSGCANLVNITVASDNVFYYNKGNCLIEKESTTLIQGCTTSSIPQEVTKIGHGAFRWLKSLTNITIPDSITSIDSAAFWGCHSLESITFEGTIAQWDAVYKDDSWDTYAGSYTIHCTDGDITK